MLNLGSTQLTDTGLKELAKLQQLTDLTPLAGLKKVEVLGLYNNNLTDVGALAGLTQLKELYLNFNNLTDVSALARLTQLKYLFLQDNPNLTKIEIAKLRVALPKCKIEHNAKN